MGEIDIREMVPGDVDEVLGVLRSALGETPLLKRTRELWAWKHQINPFGESLVLVAESEGRLAGVRAMMRWDLMTRDGARLRCLRPVDTATHPDFERRGIFRNLTESMIEKATADGFDLIFNTPNQESGPGYLKMGWGEVGPIGVMVRPLLRRGAPAPASELPDPEIFIVGDAVPAGGAVEDREPLGLRTPRTPEYTKWRFSAHPTARYRSISGEGGGAILRPNVRSGRKEIVVSELHGPSPAKAVRHTAHVARAAYLVGWFSPGSPERRAALAGGLLPAPRVTALTLVARPLRDIPVDVFDMAQWDIAMGDLELL